MRELLLVAKKKLGRFTGHTTGSAMSARRQNLYMTAAVLSVLVVLIVGGAFVMSKKQIQIGDTMPKTPINNESSMTADATEHINMNVPKRTNVDINAKDGRSKVDVMVNNRRVQVPDDGTVHKVFKSENGKTEVSISSNSTSTGTSNSTNVTDLHVNTNTYLKNSHDIYQSP